MDSERPPKSSLEEELDEESEGKSDNLGSGLFLPGSEQFCFLLKTEETLITDAGGDKSRFDDDDDNDDDGCNREGLDDCGSWMKPAADFSGASTYRFSLRSVPGRGVVRLMFGGVGGHVSLDTTEGEYDDDSTKSLVHGEKVLSGLGGGTGGCSRRTAPPGSRKEEVRPPAAAGRAAAEIGGSDTVAWMDSSTAPAAESGRR